MTQATPRDLELSVRQAHQSGDVDGAVTRAIRGYGPEVFGFLVSLHRDEGEASEVFSSWSERLWRSFDRFSWDCSLRTWVYLLARHASHDLREAQRAGRRRAVPLSEASEVSRLVAEVRTETLSLYRTATKSAINKLREELDPDDQTLLILRVDRDLGWDELARLFIADSEPTPEGVKRESARLRKRFQLIKAKLLKLGRERGVVGAGSG